MSKKKHILIYSTHDCDDDEWQFTDITNVTLAYEDNK